MKHILHYLCTGFVLTILALGITHCDDGSTNNENRVPPVNRKPNEPTLIAPLHKVTIQVLEIPLRWDCSDPDGDALRFDIYLGTVSPPPLSVSNRTTKNFTVTGLSSSQRYYWKIVAKDPSGEQTESIIRYFDTEAGETISTPMSPTGISTGNTGTSLQFAVSGVNSSLGHTLEYRFAWGDGSSFSNWSQSASQSHSWSSAGTYCIKAQARCVDHPAIESAWSSCKNVTITEQVYPCAITVINPIESTAWGENEAKEIQWSTSGDCGGYVIIDLFKSDSYVHTITSSTPNDGKYSWSVSDYNQGYATDYSIKITSISSNVYDVSNHFTIIVSQCMIDVISPNVNSVWDAGVNKEIEWNYSSSGICGSYVSLDLYYGSTRLCSIVSSTPNDGSYTWAVTSCNADDAFNYYIRITSLSTSDEFSSARFTVNSIEEVTLLVTQDAHIVDGWPNNNYGSSEFMGVGILNNKTYRSLLQFDISGIPSNATIVSAHLVLQRSSSLGSFDIIVRMIREAWSEGTITWGSDPILYTFPVEVMNPTVGGNSGTKYEIQLNVTDFVQTWVSQERVNYGFKVSENSTTSGNWVNFGTKENSNSLYKPTLNVVYQR